MSADLQPARFDSIQKLKVVFQEDIMRMIISRILQEEEDTLVTQIILLTCILTWSSYVALGWTTGLIRSQSVVDAMLVGKVSLPLNSSRCAAALGP